MFSVILSLHNRTSIVAYGACNTTVFVQYLYSYTCIPVTPYLYHVQYKYLYSTESILVQSVDNEDTSSLVLQICMARCRIIKWQMKKVALYKKSMHASARIQNTVDTFLQYREITHKKLYACRRSSSSTVCGYRRPYKCSYIIFYYFHDIM